MISAAQETLVEYGVTEFCYHIALKNKSKLCSIYIYKIISVFKTYGDMIFFLIWVPAMFLANP